MVATNQSTEAGVRTAVSRMAQALTGLATEQSLVFVASIGSPVGPGITSLDCGGVSCWGQVAQQIAALGGNPYLFNQLGPTDTYFLIGTGSPPAGSSLPRPLVEEISTINVPQMVGLTVNGTPVPPGSISGALRKDARGLYRPAQSDFTTLAPSDFFPVTFAPPIAWPYPAGTRTAAQDGAYQLMSEMLTANGSSDIRACYPSQSEDWDALLADVSGFQFDFTAQIGQQCDCVESDWMDVRTQLAIEIEYVAQVGKNFGLNGNFPTLITDGAIGTSTQIPQLVQNVYKVVEVPPNSTAQIILDVLGALAALTAIASAVASLGTSLGALAAGFGIASGVFNGAMTLTTGLASSGAAPYGAIQAEIATLDQQLSEQYQASQNAMQNIYRLTVTDWGKLSVAGVNFKSLHWSLVSPDSVLAGLYLSTERAIYQSLLTTNVPLDWRIADVLNRDKDTISGQVLRSAATGVP